MRRVLFLTTVFCLAVLSAWPMQNERDEFRGIKYGSAPTARLVKSKTDGGLTFYTDPKDSSEFGSVMLTSITYVFSDNRFYLAILRSDGIQSHESVRYVLQNKWGPFDKKLNDEPMRDFSISGITDSFKGTYQWVGSNVRITLGYVEKTGVVYVFYEYLPITQQLLALSGNRSGKPVPTPEPQVGDNKNQPIAKSLASGGGLGSDDLAVSAYDRKDYQAVIKMAEQGQARAQNILGRMYFTGEGVPKDETQSVIWFRKSAESGHPLGQFNYGQDLELGHGVPKDLTEALKWYRKAAEQGQGQAQFKLGWFYREGIGVSKDYALAIKWLELSAKQGIPNAQGLLGEMYYLGQGVPQDYPRAAELLTKSAEQGMMDAQRDLGFLYYKGLGVSKDEAEAVKWFRKAAEQGDVRSQELVGWSYKEGVGVAKDYGEALKWFKKAADQGSASAQDNVGWFYREGLGVERNYSEAFKWYKKAADQGVATAQENVGWQYREGLGVERDYSEAIKWFRKATDQNNAISQRQLGIMYRDGMGVQKDNQQAISLFEKAAAGGDSPAKKALDEMRSPGGPPPQTVPPAEAKPVLVDSGIKPLEIRVNPKDGLEYVWIPPGSFMMGCASEEKKCPEAQKPRHKVTLTHGFWLCRTEITREAYQKFLKETGRPKLDIKEGFEKYPVRRDAGSWNDAVAYCKWAGGRLPTEAEWEYAARGGKEDAIFPWGNDPPSCEENAPNGAQSNNCYSDVAEVGCFKANGFNLYDMAGNVCEWVADWRTPGYLPEEHQVDPKGPKNGLYKAIRGGGGQSKDEDLTCSARGFGEPEKAYTDTGFRCACDKLEGAVVPGTPQRHSDWHDPAFIQKDKVKRRQQNEEEARAKEQEKKENRPRLEKQMLQRVDAWYKADKFTRAQLLSELVQLEWDYVGAYGMPALLKFLHENDVPSELIIGEMKPVQ